MAEELLPKHIVFAKWFVRLRWSAIFLLLVLVFVVRYILNIPIREIPVFELAFLLFLLNLFFLYIIRKAMKQDIVSALRRIKKNIHFQISADFVILTLMLHFSGGIENPLIIYYIFHIIIASSIFSPFYSYLQTGFALILVGALAFLECYSVIPHYSLTGFVDHNLYQNERYIYGTGFVFVTTSFIVVFLTNTIISRSVKNEEAYINANLELQKKDKLKNEYVLRVTHDIKGHLAAITSILKVLKTGVLGTLNPQQEEFVSRAYERTNLLTTFVKDLLNLTKKRLRNDNVMEEFSINDVISKVVAQVQPLAQDKSIELDVFVEKDMGNIRGDPYAIEELYSNLILNAIKYTHERGHVELLVKNKPDRIISEVTDNGMGIPEDEVKRVFEEFFRASNAPKDSKTGSGLGLSIVKQIIDNHKGKIWVKSEIGVGTKFIFVLPKSSEVVLKNEPPADEISTSNK